MLFSDLIIWYLFLGGLGSGLYLVSLFIHLANRTGWVSFDRTLWKPSLIGAFAALAVGCICLIKDLSLPEKALLLFTKPTFSAITVGTFALSGLLVSLLVLIVLSLRKATPAGRVITIILEVVSGVISVVVILYTGLLLSSIAAVPLWLSPLVPVLFLLSSLSSGIAAVVLISPFVQQCGAGTVGAVRFLTRTDAIIILLELGAVFVLAVQLGDSPAGTASAASLAVGTLAPQFWLGFVACGLAVPLCMELAFFLRLSDCSAFRISLGCFVLIGAFFLRYCIVYGGIHLSSYMFT